MELMRSLGALVEAPSGQTPALAHLLDLGPPPSAAEHTDLFLTKLYPFASVYLDPSGKLGGGARDRIGGFWRALDLAPPDEPDHLTVMLSLYARLSDLETESDEADTAKWLHVRRAYLTEHLLSWLPFYCDKLTEVAAGFYAEWGALLTATLEQQSRGMIGRGPLPLHFRESEPMVDPRAAGGEAFLDALLAPIRSGLILTRADMERAGDDLDLGVRIGERRYVLESLLAQDPAATLGWLVDEAHRWIDRHQDRQSWTGDIAGFWADRTRQTHRLLVELTQSAKDTTGEPKPA